MSVTDRAPGLRISYVIPTLCEAATIVPTLRALHDCRRPFDEIVVVDAASDDETARLASPWADRLLFAPRGRAHQMNAGAAEARGDWLVFVHADTRLSRGFPDDLARAHERGALWAFAKIRLDAPGFAYRLLAIGIDWRARLEGLVTGDQVIAVRRDVFRDLGGYPSVPLMEDVLLAARLKRLARPVPLAASALTSARRWKAGGFVTTLLGMWALRLRHALGVDPQRLARLYPPVRS